MSPLNILYHISYYKPANVYGGPTQTTANLCEGLATAGVKVTVLTTNANGASRLQVPIDTPVNVDGVEVWYCPLDTPQIYFYSPLLLKRFENLVVNYDLVVLDALFTYLLGGTASLAYKAGKPYIIPLRGQLFAWALKHHRLLKHSYMHLIGRKWLERAAALHCTTPIEAMTSKAMGLKVPTFVVPNSIDTVRYSSLPSRGLFRKRFGISDNAPVLLQLGRLVPIKRADISIDTLAAAPEAHLILAGPCDAEYESQLMMQAYRLQCIERVHFTGLLDVTGVQQVLADSDILLMPTEVQENFGQAAAEGLAAGLPVVASHYIPVAVWASKTGAARVTPSNSITFSAAVVSLLADPLQRTVMGKRASTFAYNYLANANVVQQMIAQYYAILDMPRP